jgi:hypothetical protein
LEDAVNDCIVSHELLWLCHGDSSGNQKGERPALEARTRGLVSDSSLGGLSGYTSKLSGV